MFPSSPRITLKDLAAELQLSIAAVSMALRNHPRIGSKTCERVQALAKLRGYRPDPALSALVAHRQDQRKHPGSSSVALIYVTGGEDVIPDREIREEFRGIKESAEKFGYGLDVFRADLTAESQVRALRVIRHRGIRGVIFQFLDCDPSQWTVPWTFVAAIGIGIVARHSKLPLPTICTDHLHTAFDCTRQLAVLGYKRPVLLLPDTFPASLRMELLAGYLAGLREWKVPPKPRDFLTLNSESGQADLVRILEKEKTDVIICGGRAKDFADWLVQVPKSSWKTPEIYSLDLEPGEMRIGGMLQDRHGVGAVAMESLHKLILANITGPFERSQDVHIPSSWRPSTPGG